MFELMRRFYFNKINFSFVGYPPDPTYHGESRSVYVQNMEAFFRWKKTFVLDQSVMVQPEKLFLNQFNHLMLHLLERIVVSDGQMHIIIVIDHNIKVIPDIHLIGKEFYSNK